MIKSGRALIQGATRGTSPLKSVASTPNFHPEHASPSMMTMAHMNMSSLDVRGVFRLNGDDENENEEIRTTTTTMTTSSSSSETESNNEGSAVLIIIC